MNQYNNRQLKKKVIFIALAIILALALLGLVIHFIEKHQEKDEPFTDSDLLWGDEEEEESLLTIDDKDYVTYDNLDIYLLAGTDGGGVDKGEGFNGDLADFVVLLVIDNTTKKFAFYPVSRNTMVYVPVMNKNGDIQDYAFEQICTAHWYGHDEEERNWNLAEAAEDLLGGLEIDGYYVLNMKDVGKVNDTIGGVSVDIKEDLTELDSAFVSGETVRLSGDQAESYLRARMDVGEGSNAERMERQQQYMENAYDLIIGQLRENPDYVNDLYDQLNDIVESDGTQKRISQISNQIMQYENMGIINFSGETKINDTIGEGVEHEEFYTDPKSLMAGLRKVIDIKEYVETEDDEDIVDDDETGEE